MPVYLRYFYYQKLLDAKKKEKEEIDKSRKKSSMSRPKIPNYSR